MGLSVAERLSITKRYESISPYPDNVAAFKWPCPRLGWTPQPIYSSAFIPPQIFRTPAKSISYLFS